MITSVPPPSYPTTPPVYTGPTPAQLQAMPAWKTFTPGIQQQFLQGWYNQKVRPTFAGRGGSPESIKSLVDWGQAQPLAAQPSDVTSASPGEVAGKDFLSGVLDENPVTGHLREAATRAALTAENAVGRYTGLIDPASSDAISKRIDASNFKLIDNHNPDALTNHPSPVGEATGMGAEALDNYAQWMPSAVDPTSYIPLGGEAAPAIRAGLPILRQVIGNTLKNAPKLGAQGAVVGATSEAAREYGQGLPFSPGDITTAGVENAGQMMALGAAHPIIGGAGALAERTALNHAGTWMPSNGIAPDHTTTAMVPVGQVVPPPARPDIDPAPAMGVNALAYQQRGNSVDGALRMPPGPTVPPPAPLMLNAGPARPENLPALIDQQMRGNALVHDFQTLAGGQHPAIDLPPAPQAPSPIDYTKPAVQPWTPAQQAQSGYGLDDLQDMHAGLATNARPDMQAAPYQNAGRSTRGPRDYSQQPQSGLAGYQDLRGNPSQSVAPPVYRAPVVPRIYGPDDLSDMHAGLAANADPSRQVGDYVRQPEVRQPVPVQTFASPVNPSIYEPNEIHNAFYDRTPTLSPEQHHELASIVDKATTPDDLTPAEQARVMELLSPQATPIAQTENSSARWRDIHPREITANPEAYQFKAYQHAGGRTDRLAGKQWNQDIGERSAMTVHQAEPGGSLAIVDGHQRLGLLHDAIRAGNDPGVQRVRYFGPEHSIEDMRHLGAIYNMTDGSGTAIDIAKVLRGKPLTPAEAALIPEHGDQAAANRDGREIAKLGDEAFAHVVAHDVPANQAAIVGKLIHDPKNQMAVLNQLQAAKSSSAADALNITRQMMEDGFSRGTQMDMFGNIAPDPHYKNISDVIESTKKELKDDKTGLARAMRDKLILESHGSSIDSASAAKGIKATEELIAMFDKSANRAGPVMEAVKHAAANGLKGKSATDPVIAALKAESDATLHGAGTSPHAGAPEGTQGSASLLPGSPGASLKAKGRANIAKARKDNIISSTGAGNGALVLGHAQVLAGKLIDHFYSGKSVPEGQIERDFISNLRISTLHGEITKHAQAIIKTARNLFREHIGREAALDALGSTKAHTAHDATGTREIPDGALIERPKALDMYERHALGESGTGEEMDAHGDALDRQRDELDWQMQEAETPEQRHAAQVAFEANRQAFYDHEVKQNAAAEANMRREYEKPPEQRFAGQPKSATDDALDHMFKQREAPGAVDVPTERSVIKAIRILSDGNANHMAMSAAVDTLRNAVRFGDRTMRSDASHFLIETLGHEPHEIDALTAPHGGPTNEIPDDAMSFRDRAADWLHDHGTANLGDFRKSGAILSSTGAGYDKLLIGHAQLLAEKMLRGTVTFRSWIKEVRLTKEWAAIEPHARAVYAHAEAIAQAAKDTPAKPSEPGPTPKTKATIPPFSSRQTSPEATSAPASPLHVATDATARPELAGISKRIERVQAQAEKLTGKERDNALARVKQLQTKSDEIRTNLGASNAKAADVAAKISSEKPSGPVTDKADGRMNPKYAGDPALHQFVENEYAHQADHQKGGVKSVETMREGAKALGSSVQWLLDLKPGEALNENEMLRAHDIRESTAKIITTLGDKIRAGAATDAEKLLFTQTLAIHAQAHQRLLGAKTIWGRAGVAMQQIGRADDATMAHIITKAMDDGMGKNADAIAKSIKDLTGDALDRKVLAAIKPNAWDKILYYYKNNLLSVPGTHIAYTVGNVADMVRKLGTTALSEGVGHARRALGETGETVAPGEARAQAFAMLKGSQDGAKMAWQSFKENRNVFDGEERNVPIDGKLGDVIGLPIRAIVAKDQWVKGVFHAMELNSLVYRKAYNEGLRGNALSKRVGEIMMDPPSDLLLKAHAATEADTYTAGLKGNGIASWVGMGFKNSESWLKRTSDNAMGKPEQIALVKSATGIGRLAINLIAPFVKLPANVIDRALDMTPPVALARVVMANGADKDIAIGRLLMGAGIMGTVAYATSQGLMTGGGPSNRQQKALLERTGWQPYSFHYKGTYVPYNKMAALGLVMGMSADVAEWDKYTDERHPKNAVEMANKALTGIVKNLGEESFMKGVKDIQDAIADPDAKMAHWLAGLAQGFVPYSGLGGRLAGAVDEDTNRQTPNRQYKTPLEAMEAHVPGLSHNLPDRQDQFGQPITHYAAVTNPFPPGHDRHDAVASEMYRLDYNHSAPKTFKLSDGTKVKLDPAMAAEAQRSFGPTARANVETAMAEPDYTGKGLEEQRDAVRKAFRDAQKNTADDFESRNIKALTALADQQKAK